MLFLNDPSERIPVAYRASKDAARDLIGFIADEGLVISNPDIYTLAAWAGVPLGPYVPGARTSEVHSVKQEGTSLTVDMSIPDGHSYRANGIVCHNTINLPRGTQPEVVDMVYRRSWKKGLKGVTVYVDGSRDGVLISKDEPKKQDGSKIVYMNAPKRPDILPCEIHRTSVKGEEWLICVGKLNGKPYEVFGGKAEYVDIPEKYTTGTVQKNPRKTVNARYDLKFGEAGHETTIKNVIKWFENPDHGTLTRFVSMSLRHGVPTQFVVEQLQKNTNESLWDFSKVLARVLKKHIQDGTKRDKVCENCNEPGLVYTEGCLACTDCGFSKCS